jgi:hypothetical protein
MRASIRFPPNGSGSGGGSFYGTQTREGDASTGLLGYYTASPLISVLSLLPEDVDVQWLSLSSGPYDPFQFNGKVKSPNKLFYIFNLAPSNPPVRITAFGWSTVTVFRPDGYLEIFALTWSPSASYQFVACFTPFEIQPSGRLLALPNVPTTLDLVVTSTVSGGESLTPSLRSPFISSTKLVPASSPRERSRRLQNYVEGNT